jgi:DNA-binding response OmpR family regulator
MPAPNKSILFVDDHEVFGRVVSEILSQYKVTYVRTYDEAVNLLNTNRYGFVLVDFVLGGDRDGLDLCRYIREQGWRTTIFVTSATGIVNINEVREAGAQGLIEKDRNFDIILTAVVDSVLGDR